MTSTAVDDNTFPPVAVLEVASYFVRQDGLQSEPDVTPMKLQKLLYLAQAHYLGATRRRLFDEPVEAYEHGPVITAAWSRYAGLRTPIVQLEWADISQHGSLPAAVVDFLDRVWDRYKDLSASALRRLTHGQDPWRDNYVEGQAHTPIPDQDMVRYFGTKLPLDKRVFPLLPDPDTGLVDRRPTLFQQSRGTAVRVPDLEHRSSYRLLIPTVIE